MGFLDHVRRCNAHDLSGLHPFRVKGRRIGWISPTLRDGLLEQADLFQPVADGAELVDGPGDLDSCSSRLDSALAVLRERGLVGPRRGEPYSVVEAPGFEPLMWIDRGAATQFGLINFGFHLNGIVRREGRVHMWIARRAFDKATFPGMLDNMVAGGQPHGISLHENLLKECAEEAGIAAGLAARAVPAGFISYVMQVGDALRRHMMYVYDLELPADFTPEPVDGEVHDFRLMPIEEVVEIVRTDLDAFKYNCNLVIIDFLIRHGLIPPDHPDYAEIGRGLRSPLG